MSAYLLYVEKTGFELKSDPRKFYHFVNYKRDLPDFPKNIRLNDKSYSDNAKVCEMFGEFFESIYSVV